ncbi:MAG: hypothetical protein ACRDU4_19225 [Mycobacterium sp.]
MIDVREILDGSAELAAEAMLVLRPRWVTPVELVDVIDTHLRPVGYRLVGVFLDEVRAVVVAGFREVSALAWGNCLYVDDVSALPVKRGAGHADRLMTWLGGEARRLGCEHSGEELFGVAEPGGDRDIAGFQFRDRIEHHRIHHPRHRLDMADLIRQPRVIVLNDYPTPLVEASGHRLPRVQLRLYHVTIVAPTPDNHGGSPEPPTKESQRCGERSKRVSYDATPSGRMGGRQER